MLTVAHVVRRFVFQEWGGIENTVWNTVLFQRARGINAEILTTAALSVPGDEIRQGVQIRRFHYWYPYFPMFRKVQIFLDQKGGSPLVPALFKTLRREPYDLIHVHCGGRMAQVCVTLAHKRNIPCVISLHKENTDVQKAEILRMMKAVKIKFYYGGLIDRLLKVRCDVIAKADAVICSGRNEVAILKDKYPRQRFLHLPGGIDREHTAEKILISARKEWKIPLECILVLCIAPIEDQKNQLILLRLMADEPQTHVLLIGPVVSVRYYQEILSQAGALNLSSRLTVIPGLPPRDSRLRSILQEADVLIAPSEHDPFNTVILEAMTAGVPVIASDAGGLKELIVDRWNGLLFPSGSYEGLRTAYETLIRNVGLRTNLIRQAMQDVRKYGWDSLMEEMLKLYRSVICSKR